MIYELVKRLFPICRSITGNGVRETLNILKEVCPKLNIFEVPSGTKVFDWTVPQEWNIREAYIEDSQGNKIIDFKNNNLHVVGYSLPVDKIVTLDELKEHIHTIPEQPDLIPYVTSYYEPTFGFCMSENQKNSLKEGNYHMYIDSDLKDGSLTYGEIIIPGESEKEIFISTYICHPSMANNELSGPCVAVAFANGVLEFAPLYYTYRIIFIPETIGSITYLSRNLETLKKNVIAGFNISCLGDSGSFSYIPSRYGNTFADKIALNILKTHYPDFKKYSFCDRGSDERQYCSPGVDLPLCAICRSKYGSYPEYHTSADNLDFISEEKLEEARALLSGICTGIEKNWYCKTNCICEPQLGKRGLYGTNNNKGTKTELRGITDLLAYADGTNDLIDISNLTNISVHWLYELKEKLIKENLITISRDKIN